MTLHVTETETKVYTIDRPNADVAGNEDFGVKNGDGYVGVFDPSTCVCPLTSYKFVEMPYGQQYWNWQPWVGEIV